MLYHCVLYWEGSGEYIIEHSVDRMCVKRDNLHLVLFPFPARPLIK